MPECNWEEIKTSVVFGGEKKNLSVYSRTDTAPVCSSLGWNTEKSLAKRSKHWLCALEPEKDNNKHFIYSVIQHLVKGWNNSYQPPSLSFCLLLKSQPCDQTLLCSPHEERSPEPRAQTAQSTHSWRGTSCLERFCRWCPRVLRWLRTGGTCSKDIFLHLCRNTFQCPS